MSLSIRNDASYIIDMNFSFYEHQSTYNRNMPLRSMIYFVNALDDWLKENEHDLFGRKRIMIPTSHFVVFYNGVEKRPEYEEMRLSQAFYHQMEEPEIELICKAYNNNPQNNQELKRKSLVLNGYTYFVEKVRDNQKKKMNLKEAIDNAIEDCIHNHVLEKFFRNRKVVNALDDWLKENEHDLFGRKRIMIPTPHFVVFYNGVEKRPEKQVTGTLNRI